MPEGPIIGYFGEIVQDFWNYYIPINYTVSCPFSIAEIRRNMPLYSVSKV